MQFKEQVLAHQERERLSNRQVAAIYDIRNCNQVAVWRRQLAVRDVVTDGCHRQKYLDMKDQPCHRLLSALDGDDQIQALRKENEQLRAEVAYLKKLHALIRSRRLAVPTKHASSSN